MASLSSLNPNAAEFAPTFKNSPMEVEELEFNFASSSEDVRILEITKSKIFFLSHEQRGRKSPSIKFLDRSDIYEDPQTLKHYTLDDNIAVPGHYSYDGKKEMNVYCYDNAVVVREPLRYCYGKKENEDIVTTDVSLINLETKEYIKIPLLSKLNEILNLKKSVKVEVGDIAIAENKLAMHVFIRKLDDDDDSDDDDSYDEDVYEENKGLIDSLTCLWMLDTSNPSNETLRFWTSIRFTGEKYAEDPKKINCFSLNMNDKFLCRTFRSKEDLDQRDNLSLSFESNDEWENWCLEVFDVDNLDAGVAKVIQVGRGFEEGEWLSPTIATKLEPGKSNRFAIASHKNGLLTEENFAVIFNVESGDRIFDMDFYYGGRFPLKNDFGDQIEFVDFCLGQIVFIRQKEKKRKRDEVRSFQYILVSEETIQCGQHVHGNKVDIDWDVEDYGDVGKTVRKLHVDAKGLVIVTGLVDLDPDIGYVPSWERKSGSDTEWSRHSYVYNCFLESTDFQ